jgi:hypothetical protein
LKNLGYNINDKDLERAQFGTYRCPKTYLTRFVGGRYLGDSFNYTSISVEACSNATRPTADCKPLN